MLATGVEIIVGKSIIDVYGSAAATKLAYEKLTKVELVKLRDCKFQLEVALVHRGFVEGKKMGKINRITKSSGVRIHFQEIPGDVNMVIDIYSVMPSMLLAGLSMFEEELPAEASFYVPEDHHKRIIGVGGKNIQKIMKKWGVYVKFSGRVEWEETGGYFENEDNVIAKSNRLGYLPDTCKEQRRSSNA